MQQKIITFIGGGNMAQALILGLLSKNYAAQKLIVCDPNASKRAFFQQRGVQASEDNISAAAQAEVIVLAVKPQVLAQVCEPLRQLDLSNKLIISIAAGVSTQRLQQLLPTSQYIVRVMPNTPALVGEGMSGLYSAPTLPISLKQFAQDFFMTVGKTCWLSDEQDMHLVTAASGSSPAYFFLFMQAMQQTLMDMGLDSDISRLLVQQSALGAAQMVNDNPELSLAQLRENVTSKGGTTAAALAVFEQENLSQSVQRAMLACVQRSQQMETQF